MEADSCFTQQLAETCDGGFQGCVGCVERFRGVSADDDRGVVGGDEALFEELVDQLDVPFLARLLGAVQRHHEIQRAGRFDLAVEDDPVCIGHGVGLQFHESVASSELRVGIFDVAEIIGICSIHQEGCHRIAQSANS